MNYSQSMYDFLRSHRGLPVRSMAVFNFLFEATLCGILLIGLLLIIRRFFRGKLGNRAIYFAWLLVAIRLLMPIALPNPVMNELRPTHSTDLGARPIADQIRIRVQDGLFDISQELSKGTDWADRTPKDLSVLFLNASSYTSYGWTGKWVLLGYMAVAGLVLGYMVFQNVWFRGLLRKNQVGQLSQADQDQYLALCSQQRVKPIPVYLVDPLPGPCLVGVFRPFIAIPLSTPADQLPHALMHELCHYKAHDSLWGLVRNACCIVHWFNPLVWYAAQQARIDCELACDDRVVALLDEEGKAAYAKALVLDATRNTPRLTVVATGMTLKGKHMKKRLRTILQKPQVKRWASICFMIFSMIALVFAFSTAESYAPGYDMELDKSIQMWQPDEPFSVDFPEMEPIGGAEITTREAAASFATQFFSSPYVRIEAAKISVVPALENWVANTTNPENGEMVELRFTQEGRLVFLDTQFYGQDLATNRPNGFSDSVRAAVDQYVRNFLRDCLQDLDVESVVIDQDLYNQQGRYFECGVLNARGNHTTTVVVQISPWMLVRHVTTSFAHSDTGRMGDSAHAKVMRQMEAYLTQDMGFTQEEVEQGALVAAFEVDREGNSYWVGCFCAAKETLGPDSLAMMRQQYGEMDDYVVERVFSEEGVPMEEYRTARAYEKRDDPMILDKEAEENALAYLADALQIPADQFVVPAIEEHGDWGWYVVHFETKEGVSGTPRRGFVRVDIYSGQVLHVVGQ